VTEREYEEGAEGARPGDEAASGGSEEPSVTVRDRRKIDPESGQVRAPAEEEQATPAPEAAAGEAEAAETSEASGEPSAVEAAQQEAAERLADLQRLQAEYANYRKRVERERERAAEGGKAGLAAELLTVLDDVELAAAHGDLTGPFKAVGDKLVGVLTSSGVEPFGEENEAFDPTLHEAVQQTTSPEVSAPTVTGVLRRGYRIGDRVLRNALVVVTDHEGASGSAAEQAEPDMAQE
jgi:molecular chaperone GrpE